MCVYLVLCDERMRLVLSTSLPIHQIPYQYQEVSHDCCSYKHA